MSVVLASPHIDDVKPASQEFQILLAQAAVILDSAVFDVYSLHHHFKLQEGEVIYEQRIAEDRLALDPVDTREAACNGRPSSWAVDSSTGAIVVTRYASMELHEGGGVDVTSLHFQEELKQAAAKFMQFDMAAMLELNIMHLLFPAPAGMIRIEVTDEETRHQELFFGTIEDCEVGLGAAACWSFPGGGKVAVSGACIGGTQNHR